MSNKLLKAINDGLAFSEKLIAYSQGKGYGSHAVKQEVKQAVKLLRRKINLAVDVGGNVGNYSAELRALDPNIEIHVFEPSSVNIVKLRERFQLDQRVFLVNHALSNVVGSAVLHSNESGSGLASLSKRDLEHLDIPFEFAESVPVTTFDNYWRSTLFKRPIDLVKIDIEGHELNALEGFGESLTVTRLVQFEFGGCNIDTRTFFHDFWKFFQKRGFKIFRVTPFGVLPIGKYSEKLEFFSTTNYYALK